MGGCLLRAERRRSNLRNHDYDYDCDYDYDYPGGRSDGRSGTGSRADISLFARDHPNAARDQWHDRVRTPLDGRASQRRLLRLDARYLLWPERR